MWHAVKPREFISEQLDGTDPHSFYFIYVCKKTPDLVLKKKIKMGRINKKELKAMQATRKRRAPNLKPKEKSSINNT